MAQIIYKNMHVYTLHRSNNLDHKIGRPAILLKFKNKYSLIWYGTTKIDLKTKENPFILEINNVKGYFYSSGIEKVKTIFLKSKWVDYSTNNAYKLSIDEQKALFLKFASFSLEINPYLKIKELETKIEDNNDNFENFEDLDKQFNDYHFLFNGRINFQQFISTIRDYWINQNNNKPWFLKNGKYIQENVSVKENKKLSRKENEFNLSKFLNFNSKIRKNSNAYMLFSKEKRAEIIQQKPELKFKVVEVAQLIDNYWQEMTSEEKDKYVKMAETNKKIYESETQK